MWWGSEEHDPVQRVPLKLSVSNYTKAGDSKVHANEDRFIMLPDLDAQLAKRPSAADELDDDPPPGSVVRRLATSARRRARSCLATAVTSPLLSPRHRSHLATALTYPPLLPRHHCHLTSAVPRARLLASAAAAPPAPPPGRLRFRRPHSSQGHAALFAPLPFSHATCPASTTPSTSVLCPAFQAPPNAFFGVYDGHGGAGASTVAASRLHTHLNADAELWRTDPKEALLRAFELTESELRHTYDKVGEGKGRDKSGTCALAALIRGSRLFIGGLGDCRALLLRGEGHAQPFVQLTVDQRATESGEQSRILKAGGQISDGRIWGALIPSRTLGDFPWKDRGPGA